MSRLVLIALCILSLLVPAMAQDPVPDLAVQLSAMELETYGELHKDDGWVVRIGRLEKDYFSQPAEQKRKDLPVRIAELMTHAQPSQQSLDKARALMSQVSSSPVQATPVQPKTTGGFLQGAKQLPAGLGRGTKMVLTSPLFWGAAAGAGLLLLRPRGGSSSSSDSIMDSGVGENSCTGEWNCTHCGNCNYCKYCNPEPNRPGRCGVWKRLVQAGLKQP